MASEYVVKGDTKDFHITLGDMTKVPSCQCEKWTKFQMPCEHLIAAASDDDGNVQWDHISPLYLKSVYCTVDNMNGNVNVKYEHTKESEDVPCEQQKQTGSDGIEVSATDLPESVKTAQVKARESLQGLIGLYLRCKEAHEYKTDGR